MRQRTSLRGPSSDLQTLKQRAFLERGRCAAMIERLESRRLLSAGDLDTTFSGDGKVTTDLGAAEQANKVLVQSDGKIVVAGAGNGDARLVRYNANGTLDTTFSGDGIARLSWNGTETFTDAVLLPDGKIIAGGNHNGGWWIARYRANGTLDANSGFGGTDGIQSGGGAITELELQGTKIITADGSGNVRRHNANGSIDSTFGSGGTVNVGAVTGMTGFVLEDLAMAPGGKIAVAGSAEADIGEVVRSYAVARLNSNGSADTTFAGDGSFVQAVGSNSSRAAGVVAQPDGKLVTIVQEEDADASIRRLNANGTPDTSFGSGLDGRHGPGSTLAIGYNEPVGMLNPELALQSDGKILVSGWQELRSGGSIDPSADFVVQRFTSSGSRDFTFSGDSLSSVNFGGLSTDIARTIALAPDGKIVVAGETGPTDLPNTIAVVRLEGGDTTTPPTQPVYIQDRVLHVDGTAGNDTINTIGGLQTPELDVTLNGVTYSFHRDDFDQILVRGFAGNDSFEDRSISPTFEGGDGDDSVYTENHDDGDFATVFGGAGNDVVRFQNDAIGGTTLSPFDGGTGRDKVIVAGEGANLDLRDFPTVEDGELAAILGDLTGNNLDNTLTLRTSLGGPVRGGAGNDTIHGSDFDDALFGGSGNDRIMAGAGDDYIEGNLDNDTLYGEAGADEILGHQGNDYFWVREGEADTLDGGVGNYDRAQVDSIDVATNMEALIP